MPAQTNQTKTAEKGNSYVKSVAWLIEATVRAYAAYMLLNSFKHNYVAVAAGLYLLATAILIVISHFVKAHK